MTGIFYCRDTAPLSRPEDIIPFLGRASHWREGRSAYEAVHSWFDANGVPPAVRVVIESDSAFRGAVLTRAIFEKQTKLDEFGRPSQTDVLAYLDAPNGPAILGVEAKVDESFGQLVGEWVADGTPSKRSRLVGLARRLGLEAHAIGSLRYQLLHRTVATVIEAKEAGAQDAALVVQSFSPAAVCAGFADFQVFADALKASVDQPGALSRPIELDGVRLRLGWVQNSIRGLSLPAIDGRFT